MSLFFFFFFQAEDGIRDVAVTGVQTCALPITCSAPTLSEEVAIPRLRAIEIHGFPYPLAARRAVILRGLGGGEADDVRRVRLDLRGDVVEVEDMVRGVSYHRLIQGRQL